jgi:hypothetical protein
MCIFKWPLTKQEGLLREHKVRKDGTRSDMACYAVLKSEWEAM